MNHSIVKHTHFMANIDVSAYRELYIKTAHEYVEAMQASMVLMRANAANREAIETMYRSAHSLKSQSLLMGYKNTASLNEFIEHTLRNIQEKNQYITEKILSEIKPALQKIEESVASIEMLNKEISLHESAAN